MDFLLASSNPHKAQELQALLPECHLNMAPRALTVAETASTFLENAFIKAQAYFDAFQRPTLADDSGLVVTSLPQDLGPRSARFGGEGLSDQQRSALLLQKLLPFPDRSAFFVCQLCAFFGPQEVFFFEGRLHGHIAHQCQGTGGFGYDPAFIPDDGPSEQTLAQIPHWKAKNSHRQRAARAFLDFFQAEKARFSSLFPKNLCGA